MLPIDLTARAAVHAALGDPLRLSIVEELVSTDRSPTELGERLGIASNLLAHHLEVLETAGVISRSTSAGDGRRRYVRLVRDMTAGIHLHGQAPSGPMWFVCTLNSARSQLAAALWTARSGQQAVSAGTRPAARVHRGAVAAARRAGLSLAESTPTQFTAPPRGAQVVTVCDLVHEELDTTADWWHWSLPDPVERGNAAAFDEVVAELEGRITLVMRTINRGNTHQ
jgi:ArsR family transcriptional regulator, arsenate/arsenite/antimonite-responsive transcriptional repressor / arsenate reductase (thioredoxin)